MNLRRSKNDLGLGNRSIARELGKRAYKLSFDKQQRLKDSWLQNVEADIEEKKQQLSLQIKVKSEEEKGILAEIANRGNPSEESVRQNRRWGIWVSLVLILALVGEFILVNWTIKCFGLGYIETLFVAIAIVIMSLEAFDLYLNAIRKQYPAFGNLIFLVLGCMALVLIFLLIFFAAEIRQHLFQVTSQINMTKSPENTIKQAEEFYKTTSGTFIWLMITLTMAVTVIGGVSYHIAKSLLADSRPLLRLYKRLRGVRGEMHKAAENLAAQDSRLAEFVADFDTAVMMEHIKQQTRELNVSRNGIRRKQFRRKVGPLLILPLTLIAIALVIFVLLRGEARGEENIILLDRSVSVAANDLAGKTTQFQENVKAIENIIRRHLSPGDSIKVLAVTERSFGTPQIFLNAQVSTDKGAFGEKLAIEKLQLLNGWKNLKLEPTAKATDLFGAINLASILLSSYRGNKNLIIFSDMRHCTQEINLEKPQKINGEKTMARVEEMGLIPSLDGVRVWCLGVHSAGKTAVYWLSLRDFWTRYFVRAKAKTYIFSIERRFSYE